MDKLIISDVDGVLLDWLPSFCHWMQLQGYVKRPGFEHDYLLHHMYGIDKEILKGLKRQFNRSDEIRSLSPHKDAVFGVAKLFQLGYQLIVVSCLDYEEKSIKNRVENLNALFGADVFYDVICLGAFDDKKPTLSRLLKQHPCVTYYLEDNIKNVKIGQDLGLRPIVLRHPYNQYYDAGVVDFAEDWRAVLAIIVN